MKDLIERLEATTEGSRELDTAIWNATNTPLAPGRFGATWPHYTTNIDAALTLVPEGWTWDIGTTRTGGSITDCTLYEPSGEFGNAIFDSNASTPALAICATALRARSD